MLKKTPKELAQSALPLIYLVIALFALRWTLVEPYVVPTGSMEPTLKTGDRLYALKCAYDIRFPFTDWILFRTGALKRGDVILFRNPAEPSITYVKRAVGLPGDRIVYRNARLYINGEEVEKHLHPDIEVMYDIIAKDQKKLYIETLGGVRHYVILEDKTEADRRYEEARLASRVEHEFPNYFPVDPGKNPGEPRTYWEIVVPPDHFFYLGDNRDNSQDSRFGYFAPMNYLKGRAMFIWFSSWDWRIRPERIGTKIQ